MLLSNLQNELNSHASPFAEALGVFKDLNK